MPGTIQQAPFASLLNDPAELAGVTSRFALMIAVSFDTHKVAHRTQDEIKRRFAICERWFRSLRGDLGWSLQRTLDTLPKALSCELDGIRWTPPRRALWRPGDR